MVRDEPFIDWRAIAAGAVIASGVSFTLTAFGSGIGLSLMSTQPSWREASSLLWLLSGIYLLFVALASFGFAGYATGRMRAAHVTVEHESQFRDGMHGLFAWGLAILITAFVTLGAAAVGARSAMPASSGESILAVELDELFRNDHKIAGTDFEYRRAEAGRILLKSGSRAGVSSDDRAYLTNIVANYAEADNPDVRVDRAVLHARDALHNLRGAAVIQAFMIAAALFIGAAVSWFCAAQGGRDREARSFPEWNWSWRSPITRA